MATGFNSWTLATIVAAAGAFGAGAMIDEAGVSKVMSAVSGPCQIKGNISINTGERIYHVPGQEFYLKTNISPGYGERWFCSEKEAITAGWRRARR
ncbi:hypothetical protein [Phyllobacterium sp. SB3]|uniref:sunset domain-containing protein n=1 Tax=Phyllobacterium sp. SB3 TaxID=3156073 RepID=UPI0032AEAE9B